MSEVLCTKAQEEYEDDFEKDLDWLISEENQSDEQGPDYGDIEAEIEKELEEDEKNKTIPKSQKEKSEELGENEERWPSPMEPLEYDSERDCPNKSSAIGPPPPEMEDQNDEEKKYILEKIQLANRELQDQEAPDSTRQRRLHFKDKLVDLVVPPLQFEKEGNTDEVDGGKGSKYRATDSESETDISEKLSELKLFTHEESGSVSGGSCRSGESSEGGEEVKGGRVLVEIDGKFDLVSLKEVESQGLLPPIAKKTSDYSHSSQHPQEQTASSSKVLRYSSASRPCADSSHLQQRAHHFSAPRPPAQPRSRPSSASHSQRGSQRNGIKRRVQSAAGTTCQTTYSLSTQQKEQLQRMQERKEKLAREAEQRKHEEEEQRRQNNEQAFKAWLMKKREQIQEEKRIHRAQEMERMNPKRDPVDPQECFRLWLQRKQEQQQKERQLVELKRLEQDNGDLFPRREECERAFKAWLKRKQTEKRAEEQAVREHTRRLVLEERRARRMRDLLCTTYESKPFRFTDKLEHRY